MARNKGKVEAANRIADEALGVFNKTVSDLQAASDLANEAHGEHTSLATFHLQKASEARATRDKHAAVANKLAQLLAVDDAN